MSTIDLIILGILQEAPMSAYELVQALEERHVGRLLKISTPAVYKACKRLYAAGVLDRRAKRLDELTEKAVYSVNARGAERFMELMEHYSSAIIPFYLDYNAFIWNIEKVDRDTGLRMLRSLQGILANLRGWILEHEKNDLRGAPFAPRMIVRQYRMMITTLNQWIKEVISDYEKSHPADG